MFLLRSNTNARLTGLSVEADGDLRCQPGAKWEDINNTLKDKGIPLFFPVRTLLRGP
jgi:FAD/FMN-containing dehydrogenase